VHVPYEERPLSLRGRIALAVAIWIPGAAVLWWLVGMLRWWSLLVVALAIWATWDYLRKGGMFESVDTVGRIGAWLPRGLGADDPDD
jgi:hypothetical protein